jgi:hypothetical protein
MSDWFVAHRREWIAETLRVCKFGISVPQASLDLRRFMASHPKAVTYDGSGKWYVAVGHSTPPTERRPSPRRNR